MFTLCPKCGLTLAVAARDLRAARGHVRCGRCQNVFNALDSLSDEQPYPPPAAGLDGTSSREPYAGQATASSAPPAHRPEAELSPETSAPEEVAVEFDPAETAGPVAPQEPGPLPEALQPAPAAAHEQPPEAGFELEREPEPARGPALWTVGTGLLAVLLVLQIVNAYRGTLATFPFVNGALRAVYGALGIKLMPAWNVHAYEARQLGATVSGTNPREITVRASIANLAQRAQPLPLLRVTLQDRFGRAIAARDVPPSDYLPSVPSPPLLAAGGRIDASVAFISPGTRAVGFVIDACLSERHTVVCAHGP